MKNNQSKKLLSFILSAVLIAATALFLGGCNDGQNPNIGEQDAATVIENGSVYGEGAKAFTFTVVDESGTEVACEIRTDKSIVGDALLELGLITGEEDIYGLFVKNVNGIYADYNVTGTYWAFYVNGEYAMAGVDMTEIDEGSTYTFKVEK